MKKIIPAAILVYTLFLFFTACKNKPANWYSHSGIDATDSIYTGTKYPMPDLDKYFGKPVSRYADSMTVEGVELGRRLFYDKHLSKSGTRSCASCHNYKYALSDSGNVFSANENGFTTRNAPALQNLAWSGSFFWDGRAKGMSAQQSDAFEHELNFKVKDAIKYLQSDTTDVKLFKKAFGRPTTITEDKIYKAIEQFLLSAVSYTSRFDSVMRGEVQFTPSEYRGYYNIFFNERGECLICHRAPISVFLLTDDKFNDNGLDLALTNKDFKDAGKGGVTKKSFDYGKFKTPTLRNVALTAPYMHDGRFKTLRQVIDFYSDSVKLSPNLDPHLLQHIDVAHSRQIGGMHFTEAEKQDLLNFLYTLTDRSFINNQAFKDPYPEK